MNIKLSEKLKEASLYQEVVKVNVPLLDLQLRGSVVEIADQLRNLELCYGIGEEDVEFTHES